MGIHSRKVMIPKIFDTILNFRLHIFKSALLAAYFSYVFKILILSDATRKIALAIVQRVFNVLFL